MSYGASVFAEALFWVDQYRNLLIDMGPSGDPEDDEWHARAIPRMEALIDRLHALHSERGRVLTRICSARLKEVQGSNTDSASGSPKEQQ